MSGGTINALDLFVVRVLAGATYMPEKDEDFVPLTIAHKLERDLAAATERIAALERERDTALQHLCQQSRDAGLLEAEVERLKALLLEREKLYNAQQARFVLAENLRVEYETALKKISHDIDCDGPGCHWCESDGLSDGHPPSTAADIARAALGEGE